ncbi:MAG: FabA/FabZ family ACP-dehydratase [Verrucomicrobiota bacterium]
MGRCESARGVKIFAPGEPFFQGHFPGNPLVPGVLLTEALAQIAGIAAGEPGRSFRLAAIRSMKFLRPIRLAERVDLAAEKTAEVDSLLRFSVIAIVDGISAAEGSVVLSS